MPKKPLLPANTTLPVLKVWSPAKLRPPPLSNNTVPVNVSPLRTNRRELVKSKSPLTLIPSNVPPLWLKVSLTSPTWVTVPPLIVPPFNVHDPLAVFSPSVAPFRSSTPVTLTLPPVRLNVPRFGNVNVPPRFTVVSFALIVPLLIQRPSKVSVPPPLPSIRPALFQVGGMMLNEPPFLHSKVPEFSNSP